jgi:hypothetical protein
MKKASSLKEACEIVVREMKGAMTRRELVDAVTKLYPSKAKNPSSSVMNIIRYMNEVVPIGDARYARVDYVSDGAKFRIVLAGDDIVLGVLKAHWFKPFDQFMAPIECKFVDGDGVLIPVVEKSLALEKLDNRQLKERLLALADSITLEEMLPPLDDEFESLSSDEDDEDNEDEDENEIDGIKEEETLLNEIREKLKIEGLPPGKSHDFTEFFKKHGVREGDSVIVTVHPAKKTFVFEHEPAEHARTSFIEEHDEEVRRLFHASIERRNREYIHEIVLRAYANLAWMKEYPCHHWLEIVENDDELRILKFMGISWEIASIDYALPLDELGVDESTARKLDKRLSPIIREAEEFYARLEKAIDGLSDTLGADEIGGLRNVIKKSHRLDDDEEIIIHNLTLIDSFLNTERNLKETESVRDRKIDSIEMFAEYLLKTEEIPLEYASLDDVADFIFDWYPTTVMGSSPTGIEEVAEDLRDFYRHLVSARIIRNAVFAEAIYRLRDLAVETIELYRRLPNNLRSY